MKINLFAAYEWVRSTLTKKISVGLLTAMATTLSFANPVLDHVTNGEVTVNQTSSTTQVVQSSQQAILEWKSFNIGASEKTQFVQPSANAVALNRISPAQGVSQIYGTLTSNGTIILINGAGIHFGPGSVINVGSLIASTSDISNANFLARKYIFDQPTSYDAAIINEGKIRASHYGLVALVGSNVVNNGLIRASLGTVLLATGDKFTLDFYGDELINFTVDAPSSHGGRIKNTGSIFADGGRILISAQTAQNVLDNVIDMQGVMQANSVSRNNGEIILSANSGTIRIAGKLTAKGNQQTSGGSIKILANTINVTPKGSINASGNSGGSVVLAGYNSLDDALVNAAKINISPASLIQASGSYDSNGGSIKLAANIVKIAGKLDVSAKTGNGGKVNIGGNNITLTDTAYINAASIVSGNGGEVDLVAQNDIDIAGEISTQGGYQSGNGGAIHVFANRNVDITGVLDAAALAASSRGGMVTVIADNAHIDGVLNVSAKQSQSQAGDVQVFGRSIYLDNNADIDASGFAAGGQIIIGGSEKVQNPHASAARVTTAKSSLINASAINSGNGGSVIITSAGNSAIAGEISAESGYLRGDGGTINITSKDNTDITGVLDASSRAEDGMGGFVTVVGKKTEINSVIDVSAQQTNGQAGRVDVLGEHVYLDDKASINASGASAGGRVNIGGNQQGNGSLLNADATTVAAGSLINVSALVNGNAGKAIIWSQAKTNFGGTILAQGGAVNGDGGFAEVSSHDTLNFQGNVNTLAPEGKTGTLLLDPASISIQDSATPNPNYSVITVASLESQLATSNVLVQTGSSGTQVGDITVANNLTWGNKNTLTLSAFRNINVNATVSNNSGGSIVLNTDNTHNGTGTITFGQNGSINFSGGGTVSLYYNTNNIANPNFYYGNISVGNGTTFTQDPLNALTTNQNAGIISSIVQMTSYSPFVAVASTKAPIDTDSVNNPETVTTMDNDLEKVVEEQKPVEFELASSTTVSTTPGAADGNAACQGDSCYTTDFIIK
jgi:filamentous hemagglutinin family protein